MRSVVLAAAMQLREAAAFLIGLAAVACKRRTASQIRIKNALVRSRRIRPTPL
jgi:hypothetical protein